MGRPSVCWIAFCCGLAVSIVPVSAAVRNKRPPHRNRQP